MSPTLTTFLFELANFLLLVILLGWLLFKPVRAALEARQVEEQRRRDALAAQERTLVANRAELETQRAAFADETAKQRKQQLAGAEAEAAAIVAAARQTAERDRERNKRRLEQVERAQVERLTGAVASAARDAVARWLTTLHTPDMDQALARAACRELGNGAGSLGSVLVESAGPLTDELRAAITSAAGERAASIEFRVTAALGTGLRITTAAGLIDASAAGVAAHAGRALSEALADSQAPEG